MCCVGWHIEFGCSNFQICDRQLRPDADVCYARRKQPECTEKINNQPADVTNQNQSPEHHTEARLGAVHASSSSAALSWMSGHHTVSSIQSTLQCTFPADTQVWYVTQTPCWAESHMSLIVHSSFPLASTSEKLHTCTKVICWWICFPVQVINSWDNYSTEGAKC